MVHIPTKILKVLYCSTYKASPTLSLKFKEAYTEFWVYSTAWQVLYFIFQPILLNLLVTVEMERIRKWWKGDREKKLKAKTMLFTFFPKYIQVFFYTINLKKQTYFKMGCIQKVVNFKQLFFFQLTCSYQQKTMYLKFQIRLFSMEITYMHVCIYRYYINTYTYNHVTIIFCFLIQKSSTHDIFHCK